MKKRKLIIISNDALVNEDLKYLATKPCMREIMEKGSVVSTLKTVYPSITYCCHASMITGCYPDRTGVRNNEVDEFGNKDWLWERKYIKVKTLLDAAKEKGLTTANVFWPVLGNDSNIDYNIPEYWSQSGDDKLCDAFMRMGTSRQVIDDIVKPNLYYIEGHQRQHPYCDEFIFACARDMIFKYNPDVLVVHPAGIDGMRHRHGIFNDYVIEQIDYTWYWVEKIFRAVKEMGQEDITDIVLTSDHGQMNNIRNAHVNVLLKQKGFITVGSDGKAKAVKAYAKPVGGSAQVFLVDKSQQTYDEVYSFLRSLVKDKLYGIERCYTADEAKNEERLAGDFSFVLESDGYTGFGGNVEGEYYTGYDVADYRTGRGTHGYHPDKGPQPCMVCVGPDFKSGVVVDRRNTIDMAVTLAKALELDLSGADGEVIEEILA